MKINRVPDKYIKAIQILADKLNSADISWMLTGSSNLVLQGVDIEIGDIDIQVESSQIAQLNTILSKHVKKHVSYTANENFRSKFGIFDIYGIQVEAMADLEICLEGNWIKSYPEFDKRITINVGNTKLFLMSLEQEYEGYKKLGRNEKAKKIKELVDKKSK